MTRHYVSWVKSNHVYMERKALRFVFSLFPILSSWKFSQWMLQSTGNDGVSALLPSAWWHDNSRVGQMNGSFDTQCSLEVPRCISLLNRSWLPYSRYRSVSGEIRCHLHWGRGLFLHLYLYLVLWLPQRLETLTGKFFSKYDKCWLPL